MKRSLIRLQRYVEGMNSLQKMEDMAPHQKKHRFRQPRFPAPGKQPPYFVRSDKLVFPPTEKAACSWIPN